jgi:hypothetical protein
MKTFKKGRKAGMKNHPTVEFNNELREKILKSLGIPSGTLIDENQLARIMRRGIQTIRNKRLTDDSDAVPYIKLGRSVRYLVDDVVDTILKNRINRAN